MLAEHVVERILAARGITDREAFVRPDFTRDQHDATLMKGMDVTIARLRTALGQKERVAVFGDYDADGVPATALLVRTLGSLGMNVEPLIPTRAQGYGLTQAIVQALLASKPDLVLTVDNGTVSKREVAELVGAGIDVIVIDHHEPQEGEMADTALAIINPKQPGCPYPFKEMCACALAWKVVDQLFAALGKDRAALRWELDLVGVSTIADMVPLIGENRLLALYGLKVLRKTRNLGLKALMLQAGMEPGSVSAGDVGFKIAPRINAPSRMHAEIVEGRNAALALLTATDERAAATLARHLGARNAERQGLVDAHIKEAEAQALAMTDSLALVVHGEVWSTGVIGLVASRLLEMYRRPVIALAPEDGMIKGSVRSVDGVNAVEMLNAGNAYLERFGGHAKAAGLTMRVPADIDAFRAAVHAFVAREHSIASLAEASERHADIALELADVTLELCAALEELEPFGIGFARPIFETECQLDAVRTVGTDGKHLSCFLTDGVERKKSIGFGLGHMAIEPGRKYLVRYTVEAETWRDVTSPNCRISAILNA
jgi:single-stranded-DNA-specific exonuclease